MIILILIFFLFVLDQVAVKMSSEPNEVVDYERYMKAYRTSNTSATSSSQLSLPTTATTTTTTTNVMINSSDSEQDDHLSLTYQPKEMPKRNKRKNFKPRCSSSTNVTTYPISSDRNNTILLNEFSNNNSNLKNANNNRRRKQYPPTRLVDDRFSPMDLSKGNDSDTGSEISYDYHQNDRCFINENDIETDDGNENNSSENDTRIPTSFSIHNLSKSHVVNDYGNAASGMAQGQVCDMREYAVNTMRELLGIYGLTSEVAESITRQLPIAAFSTGKLLLFIYFFKFIYLFIFCLIN